jgi:hypothetical protein
VKYGFVAERIADLSMLFDIKAIAFDQYRIKYLEPELESASVSVPLILTGRDTTRRRIPDCGCLIPSNSLNRCWMMA